MAATYNAFPIPMTTSADWVKGYKDGLRGEFVAENTWEMNNNDRIRHYLRGYLVGQQERAGHGKQAITLGQNTGRTTKAVGKRRSFAQSVAKRLHTRQQRKRIPVLQREADGRTDLREAELPQVV